MPRRIRPLLSNIDGSSPKVGCGKLTILLQLVPLKVSPVFVSASLGPVVYSPPSTKILSLAAHCSRNRDGAKSSQKALADCCWHNCQCYSAPTRSRHWMTRLQS